MSVEGVNNVSGKDLGTPAVAAGAAVGVSQGITFKKVTDHLKTFGEKIITLMPTGAEEVSRDKKIKAAVLLGAGAVAILICHPLTVLAGNVCVVAAIKFLFPKKPDLFRGLEQGGIINKLKEKIAKFSPLDETAPDYKQKKTRLATVLAIGAVGVLIGLAVSQPLVVIACNVAAIAGVIILLKQKARQESESVGPPQLKPIPQEDFFAGVAPAPKEEESAEARQARTAKEAQEAEASLLHKVSLNKKPQLDPKAQAEVDVLFDALVANRT